MRADSARSGELPAGPPPPGRRWAARLLPLPLLAAAVGAAAAPLPPGRPAEFGRSGVTPPALPSPPVSPVPAETRPSAPPAEPDRACLDALSAAASAEPAPQPRPENAACHIETPVRLSAVTPEGSKGAIALPEGPVVACRFARPFAEWLGRIASPVLAAARGSPVKAVRTGPGFACRNRNSQPGEKPSAHGLGLAIDISAFEFIEGPPLAIKPDGHSAADAGALAALRRAACGWFTTVLGPGSDPAHTDHLHLDIQWHGSSDRYRICQ